jgi:hypothetical protein
MSAISRIRLDERTQAFVARKTAEGKSKRETIRTVKRYIAREVYYLLRPSPNELTRPTRPRGRSTPAGRHGAVYQLTAPTQWPAESPVLTSRSDTNQSATARNRSRT